MRGAPNSGSPQPFAGAGCEGPRRWTDAPRDDGGETTRSSTYGTQPGASGPLSQAARTEALRTISPRLGARSPRALGQQLRPLDVGRSERRWIVGASGRDSRPQDLCGRGRPLARRRPVADRSGALSHAGSIEPRKRQGISIGSSFGDGHLSYQNAAGVRYTPPRRENPVVRRRPIADGRLWLIELPDTL